MATLSIKVGNVTLAPFSKLKASDELIWSENTGRVLTKNSNGSYDATMKGDCIGEKMTFEVEWEMITEAQYKAIKNALKKGFFDIKITEGSTVHEISSYRSNIERDVLGLVSGTLYYKTVSVQIIER